VSSLASAGDAVTARSELKRTLSLVRGRDDLTLRALTAWDAPLVWRVRVTDDLDPEIVDPLRRLLAAEQPDAVRTKLLVRLFAELEGADPVGAVAASREAVEVANRIGTADTSAHRLRCAVLNAAAYCALGPDDAANRDRAAAEFLAYAQEVGEADYDAVAHWLMFLSASARSDLENAQRHVDLAVAHAGTGQLGHLLTVLDIFTAQLTILAGRIDEAEERYLASAARLAEHGAANGAHITVIGRISAALARGDLAPLADELLFIHEQISTTVCEAAALSLIAAGRTDEARRIWAERQPVERSYYWLAMTTLRAHVAVALRDEDEARRCATELAPYGGRMAGLENGSLLVGPVDAALAAVAELLGDGAAAQRHRAAADALTMRLAADAARLVG
jgi:hypothetical protein